MINSFLNLDCLDISADLSNKSDIQSILKPSITTLKSKQLENTRDSHRHTIQTLHY